MPGLYTSRHKLLTSLPHFVTYKDRGETAASLSLTLDSVRLIAL
jgi:hypothetical protein